MTGQQVGAVVGGIIGAFFGMPQLGAAIGGLIGGWIAPTQIDGPHIGDGAPQTSAEGQPIPWIIGTAGWVSPNIVDKSPRREVKKTDDGKGSGTEVNTFEAHQDFVLMVCESSETRESLMTGVLIVRIDGKIVYDMRPDMNFDAENAKFLENHTFYNGNESQLPDPTAESFPHNGVGNTPAYRGVYTVVARDINLTQYGDRIPNYEFVMVGAGESDTVVVEEYVPPVYGRFQNAHWPLVDPESFYTYTGVRNTGSGTTTYAADTIQEIIDYFATLGFNGYPSNPNTYLAYSATTGTSPTTTFKIDTVAAQLDVTNNTSVVLVYSESEPVEWLDAEVNEALESCILLPYVSPGQPEWYGFNRGELGRLRTGISPPPTNPGFTNCVMFPPESGTFPYIEGIHPLWIRAESRSAPPEAILGDPCILGVPTLVPDSPGFVMDCAGEITPARTYTLVSDTFLILQAQDINTVDGRTVFIKRDVGPVMLATDPANTQAFWEAAYDAAVIDGTMEAGLSWPGDYPVNDITAYLGTYSLTSLTNDTVGVDTAITRIALRGGLTVDDLDVSEMDQELLGYPIMQSYNGADCIRPLMTAFTSYGSEYDAKLRFHKHGEVIEVVVDPEDFIEGSETDKATREQAVEYPRLISVTAIDPTQDYTPRPQSERRITPDVRAIGEQQIQVPIVLDPDHQRQLASIAMKVAWARAQGSREFSLPYVQGDEYLYLVAGKPFALDGKRYIASEYGLEDGEIKIKGLYDRQSAYTSNVTATPALPPTPPPSSIGGVTLFAALNAGVFRDQDDRVGIYIAVAGILAAWPGALIQWKLDTDSDWQTAIGSATQASTMGYLTAPLPLAPASGDDVTNTLSVSVHGGELNSITRFQYLNEANPYAIITDETTGECELGQFQFADETAPGEYDLTTLVRGGLNTTPAAHAQGARFVFLDSVYFLEIPSAWIGRTINLRPVTFGTIPDNNATYSIVFDPAVSQTEWQVGHLAYTEDSGTVSLVITPRHRLGNDATPIASTNFIGYQIEVEDDADQYNAFTSATPTVSIDISTLTTPVTITVSALNRITGPGPSMSIVIP